MIIQPDLILRDTLRSFFDGLKTNSSIIDRVFASRPATERQEMKTYFEASPPPIRLGYPMRAAELPGIFVVLGVLQETDRGQTIGETLTPDVVTSTTFTEERGSHFSSVVRLACWSLNGDLTVWLQSLAFVALLLTRSDLNNVGLVEQKLSASDFEPLPQWFPDVAYRRNVDITMTVPLSVPVDFSQIVDVVVNAEGTPPPNVTQVVVVRR